MQRFLELHPTKSQDIEVSAAPTFIIHHVISLTSPSVWKRDTTFYVELKCVWFSVTVDKQHFFSIT